MKNEGSQPCWQKSLQKSMKENAQLEFWRDLQISYINLEDKLPEIEMIKFKKIIQDDENNRMFLVSVIDKRTKFYKNLIQNPKIQLCWFFPLSREKYRIKSDCFFISRQDYTQSKPVNDETIKGISAKLLVNEFKQIWDQELSKEERKEYTEAEPGTETILKKHDDLNDFNTPEIFGISANFAIILCEPYESKLFKIKMN